MSKSQLQFLPLILLSLHDCIDYTGTAQQVLSEEGGGGLFFFGSVIFFKLCFFNLFIYSSSLCAVPATMRFGSLL